jgi:hypothetical protein
MEKENTFDFTLRVATTGTEYSFTNVPKETTIREILAVLMEHNRLDAGLEVGWELLYGAKILSKDTVISDVISENQNNTFELIAKVEAG